MKFGSQGPNLHLTSIYPDSLDRIGLNLDTISIKDTEVGKVNFWAFIGMLGYGSVRLVLGGIRLGKGGVKLSGFIFI